MRAETFARRIASPLLAACCAFSCANEPTTDPRSIPVDDDPVFAPASDPEGTAQAPNAPVERAPGALGPQPPPDVTPNASPEAKRPLIAYWATWTRGTLPVSAIPWSQISHVAHAFVLPSAAGGLSNGSTYPDRGLIREAHARGVKVLASVGGWGANFDGNVDPVARGKTVRALAALCRDHGYDGIDLDWEYPTAATAAAWGALVDELRAALDAIDPDLTLSAAVAAAPASLRILPRRPLERLSWLGVMTYDYAGPWSARTGHGSPLRRTAGGETGSTAETVDYLIDVLRIAPEKLFVGLAFYGYQFAGNGLASTLVKPTTNLDYRLIAPLEGVAGWTKRWDATAEVPTLVRAASPGFVSFEDPRSIGRKCEWASERRLGGSIVWHLAGDRMVDGRQPLLEAAQRCR